MDSAGGRVVPNRKGKVFGEPPPVDVDFDKVPAFAKLGLSSEVNVIDMEGTADTIRETQTLLGS